MSLTPAVRQRHILDLLGARQSLTIQELVAELGVSAMTVHRDLNRLADGGQLLKTHGGAALPSRANHNAGVPGPCAMCNRPVPERSAVILQSQQRGRLTACCPHCGLALLRARRLRRPDAGHRLPVSTRWSARTTRPTWWAATSRPAARRGYWHLWAATMQSGFSGGLAGEIMSLVQVRHYLRDRMSVPEEP